MLHSRTERLDFSGVLATALAFGEPVVQTAIGGFAEVADTGAAQLVDRTTRTRCARLSVA
jgi:glycosyltransferase involved in cell wall biosynthesis